MKMKKVIILISMFLTLVLCAGLSVNAEAAITDEIYSTSDIIVVEDPALDVTTDEDEAQVLISEAVKDFVNKYLSEIASIATVILTAILTFLYKKGLLPVVSKGFTRLVEMLNIFKSGIEERVTALSNETKPVIEQMNKAVEECAEMKKSFDKLQVLYDLQTEEKKLLEQKVARSDERDMLTCEMLYQLLMCTNVPQYMKDKVAEFYESSKKTILSAPVESKAVTHDETVS